VEYPLFGVDFDRRGQTFRESVATVRAAWRTPLPGDGISAPELGLDAALQLDVLPKPVSGGIPLVVAGKAQQSLEWIAEHADGWFNYPRDLAGLTEQIEQWRRLTLDEPKPYLMPMMLDLAEDPGTPPSPIFHGMRVGMHALLDHVGALGDRGVAHLSLSLRCATRPVVEVLHELAESVLAEFPGRPSAPITTH
jgi:luciferase-type oxidoreductase